jgi:uncharacterized protein YjbI with pentapeptide repeats
MEPTLKTRLLHLLRTAGIILLFTFVLAGLVFGVSQWTGPAKTPWDWLDLLLLPLLLSGGSILLYRSQRESERRRAALKREIAADHQHESALQAYVDRMSELLLKEKLSRFSSDEVRNVARLRTLTLLRSLDARRKGLALLFLKESGLVEREAVIDLCGADLRRVPLPFASLNRVNLGEAHLSGADLHGASLARAYLSETDLSETNLNGANLSSADLFGANLSGADLRHANLSGANLSGADLSGCRLDEADLSKADLSGVHLKAGAPSGTPAAKTELKKARSLEGAILPDGTKHE